MGSPKSDLYNSTVVTLEENRATVTATGDDIIDMKGYEEVLILVEISAVSAADSSNYLTFTLQESDDDDFSDGTEVALTDTSRVHGTLPVINNTNLANTIKKFSVAVGTKRYLKIIWTETATASAVFSIVSIKSGARHGAAGVA